jgi:predicted alpha/beta-fold hydrolase
MRPFVPHPLLRQRHLMTLAGALWPRRTPHLPAAQERLFEVEAGTQILAKCHWQAKPRGCPTLVLVHGLEGSSESSYMRGTAEKAFLSGFNVLRLNQRNCGGSDRLTPTVYNSGLSGDFRAVLEELISRDGLRDICFAGYSMGGNLVLKMAGELGAAPPAELIGVCGVCPTLELAVCVDAISQPDNRFYQTHFVRRLKARMRRKARLFPGRFDLGGLERLRTIREFDDAITAPNSGYQDAVDYYERASAIRSAGKISVPTLILTAKDDPIVPFSLFAASAISGNPRIQLEAPEHGGHCSFISRWSGWERHWAEARVLEFFRCIAKRSSGDSSESGALPA